jgi:2-polyprenyl-3-methyl-5-hydroxy-6-metoxy-1,4-benzoquinol methylase
MPTSDYHQISDVLHVIEQVRPARVLDVGVGFGKWGFLCREILDVYYERVQPETWTTVIDGIEIYEPYRNPTWALAYNQIHIGDAREILPGLGQYDLIICCDVIEHFEKPDGTKLIDELLRHAPVLIVTTPAGYAPQGAAYGNIHESHLSSWSQADLVRWPHRYKLIGFTFMAVIGRDEAALKNVEIRQPLEVLGVKRGALELLRMAGRRLRRRSG